LPRSFRFLDQSFILLGIEMALQLRHRIHRYTHDDEQRVPPK
jgi:hypothetical protein